MKAKLTGPLRQVTPTTVSAAPASSGRQRGRKALARRTISMTASSAPVRMNRRTRLARPSGVDLAVPYLAGKPEDRLHTTARRGDRSLIAAPNSAPLYVATIVCPPGFAGEATHMSGSQVGSVSNP